MNCNILKVMSIWVLVSASSILFGADANLLKNSDFEATDGNAPVGWFSSRPYIGHCKLIQDVAQAYQGNNYLILKQTRKLPVNILHRQRFRVGQNRKLDISLAVKGKGKLYVMGYLYSNKRAMGSIYKEFIVDSEKWKIIRAKLTIPEKRTKGKTGEEKIVKYTLALHVIGGPVMVDDIKMYLAGTRPPETPAKKTPAASAGINTLTIPEISIPPKIDGVLDDKAWKQAASITGFYGLDGKLSSRQTLVYMCYDLKNFYFAFKIKHEGKFGMGTAEKIKQPKHSVDAVEVWLAPTAKKWYHLYGVPGGGYTSNSKGDSKWDCPWKTASKVKIITTTAGAIQTFNTRLWTYEVAIPYNTIGIGTVKTGGSMRINFCRDISTTDKERSPRDWTTLSPLLRFNNIEKYLKIRFGGKSPALQITSLGDLRNGLLGLKGNIVGKQKTKLDINTKITFPAINKNLFSNKQQLIVPESGSQNFTFNQSIKLKSSADLLLSIKAIDQEKKTVLADLTIPFSCATSFSLKLKPVYSKKILFVDIDTSRVPGVSADSKITIEIVGTKVKKMIKVSAENRQQSILLDISSLSPDNYQVRGMLMNSNGKAIASVAEPLPVPVKPAWMDNKIGIVDIPPAPWKPLQVKGNIANSLIWKYEIGKNGLPKQISGLNKTLLTAPAMFKTIVNGKPAKWNFKTLKLLRKNAMRSEWAVNGNCGALKLKGILRMEYDGFAKLKFQIIPEGKQTINALSFEFPLKKRFARYVNGSRSLPPEKYCWASLYKTFSSAKKVDIGGKKLWIYSPKWIWQNIFFHSIFVGGYDSGLGLVCETDRYIYGSKYVEFLEKPNARIMRVNLISKPVNINQPLEYAYAYIATPTKPEPKFKQWRTSGITKLDMPEQMKVIDTACAYHLLDKISYPKLHSPKNAKRYFDNSKKIGYKLVPDFYLSAASSETPEFKLYGEEWTIAPGGGWTAGRGAAKYTSHAGSYSQFLLDTVKKMVENLGFNGVYLDVSESRASTKPWHGGWVDEQGRKRAVVPAFATRELYKRLYTYLHTGNRNGVVFTHLLQEPITSAFLDVVTEGEEWCVETGKQYTRLSPDMFQAKLMRNHFGTPFIFYAFHQYVWRGNKYGTPIPLDEILMMGLPHRVLPLVLDQPGMKMMPQIWKLVEPWWTSAEFIPYWDSNCPVSTGSETVLSSIYLKRKAKSAMLIVSNWQYKSVDTVVEFDLQKLGVKGDSLKMREIYPQTRQYSLTGNRLQLNLAARRFKIIILKW
ncbi:MAG: DUF6067 family protein [Victivallaceae bacterium]|nr:DUF6067 family protein [Victivallaceae bacterium]